MVNYPVHALPYANNATITTALSRCDQTMNISRTIEDLYNLYRNTKLNPFSSEISDVSINNFNCTKSSGKYFEQIIKFTNTVSMQIQITLASIYYDYINTNIYILNGFYIDPDQPVNLSSITLNNTAQSDACSSIEIAQDSLCSLNSTKSICNNAVINPWIFNCSENITTSIANDNELLTTTAAAILSSGLKSWQIGLICSLSFLFVLFTLFITWNCFRRHLRSKRITFSRENLFDDMKLMQKSGIPYGQAYHRTPTIIQPIKSNSPTIPWIHERTDPNIINRTKPYGPSNQNAFIFHTKILDPVFPVNFSQNVIKQTYIPNTNAYIRTPKIYQRVISPRPSSGTSINQLKSITNDLQERTLDKSDTISLDPSNSTRPKQFVNRSFDESLHDEDAWMSILDVANAELAVLNRLENEQNGIRTII